MSVAASIVEYLKHHQLVITTAESCTAGKIITLLSQVDGSGSWIESGYVVYSPEAKQRLLNVRRYTIDTFNLTSCEVAQEMAQGALRDGPLMWRSPPLACWGRMELMAFPQALSVLPGPIETAGH